MKPFDGAGPSSMGQDAVYAELYEDTAGGTVVTITTAATYYGWTTASKGLVSGRMFLDLNNATADRIQVQGQGKGIYAVTASCSALGLSAANVNMAVFKNGVIQPNLKTYVAFAVLNKAEPFTVSGLVELADGDYVDLRFTSNTNADTVTIYTANLSLVRVS